jgi:hypothetical protein
MAFAHKFLYILGKATKHYKYLLFLIDNRLLSILSLVILRRAVNPLASNANIEIERE